MKKSRFLLPLLLMAMLQFSCRTDDEIIYSEQETLPDTVKTDTIVPPAERWQPVGMYVLCEGNMGSNKCTLDYLDLSVNPPVYNRNIYSERNPQAVKELGDVGNDVEIYGSRLWMVINCSNKVEVATADDCRRLGKIDIANCRSLAFHDGYAYVSSFYGPLLDPEDLEVGTIFKIDTLTLQKVDSVFVGWQPEEMAVVDGKLYVANSGGYRDPDYDHTLSIIDLETFREERRMDIGLNPHRVRADRQGKLWVTTRGDYYTIPPRLYCLKPDEKGNMQVDNVMDLAVSDLCIVGDSLYFYGSQWSEITMSNTVGYGIINTSTQELHDAPFASQLPRIQMPYAIMVHPDTRDVFLMDAKNYVSSGELFCLSPDGVLKWSVKTGDIPGHACFLMRRTEE
ncbi:MAG: YncE family protein [Prevotella sp.]|nr:YncE family protein [Prevotella sp.]